MERKFSSCGKGVKRFGSANNRMVSKISSCNKCKLAELRTSGNKFYSSVHAVNYRKYGTENPGKCELALFFGTDPFSWATPIFFSVNSSEVSQIEKVG